MATVQVRVDSTGIQHMFLFITDDDGNSAGYGFHPATPGSPWTYGKVRDDTDHVFDKSWTYDLTPQQLADLQAFIFDRQRNPGIYEGWDRNCVTFAAQALRSAGVAELGNNPATFPVEVFW